MDVLLSADRWLFSLLNGSLHWGPIDALMMTVSEVKHFYLLLTLFLALLIWKGGPTGRATAVYLMIALIVSDQVASFVIKPLVHRMRPCHDILGAIVLGGCGEGKSFPSTHAMNSFAFMTVLAAAFPKHRRWYYAGAALIAYSRIHVGAHYPLDVLCGAGFGYGLGRGLVWLRHTIRARAWHLLRGVEEWYRALRYGMEWIRVRRYALPVLAGILLGSAYPGTRYGWLASIGLIPLLIAIERIDRRHWWSYFKIFYVSLFVWHGIANYWIGGWSAEADGFLMIACVVLMFVHPLFLMVPLALYSWVRRRLGLIAGLAALPFLWVGFEYLHSIGDLGYPWLTLGNTQTYYTEGIQFIEFTGVYGASFLLVVQNIVIILLLRAWRERSSIHIAHGMAMPLLILVATIFLPAYYSEWVFRNNDLYPIHLNKFRVAVIQPNIDPWAKWTTADEATQINQMKTQSRAALVEHPDMLLWPETAIPFYLTLPMHRNELIALHLFVDSCNVPLLTGVPDMVFYRYKEKHPADAKPLAAGNYTATFNSSTLVTPGDPVMPMYHKMQLVPFGERTPFVDEWPILANFVAWSVGLSGWSKGTDYTIFNAVHERDTARVYGMICYESVYPSLVREFVARGATLLTVITNDGWYGRTSGPVQHQQYAVLRAIENRRAVARCANTGISCFIDRFGNVDKRTRLYESATIIGDCELNSELSIYSRYGDWLSLLCCGVGALALGAAALRRNR